MTRLTSPAVALASPCPECLAVVPDDTAPLPKAGFYSCAAGRFFVSKTGLVFELLDEELDGPEEALVALLPPDAEPMPAMYLLPSFVLRIAARTGLDVPTPLRAPPAAELLDELHWRGDAGWAPVAGEELRTLAALAAGNFVALADGSARVGDASVEVLDRLTHALCDAPFGDSAPCPRRSGRAGIAAATAAPSRRWPTSATSCAPCSGSTPGSRWPSVNESRASCVGAASCGSSRTTTPCMCS